MKRELVSVIMPCFNAEMWLKEAIDSCLQQTYPEVEIIVVDDGSTDSSLEIIKNYGDSIIWESGLNRGGNYVRNRGFALSSGKYIQYLDADDYILPEKIERQVNFLEETGADIIYGDWRYKRHLQNGTNILEDIKVCGPKADFLKSILADERWVPPVALLYRRDAIERADGWDESLKAAQDRDFLMSTAINGEIIEYQSGCYSIYRKYGAITVSTSDKLLWMESHFWLMRKAEAKLDKINKLSSEYRLALACGYYAKSMLYNSYLPLARDIWVLRKITTLYPGFIEEKSPLYNLTQKTFGFFVAELIFRLKRRVQGKLYRWTKKIIRRVVIFNNFLKTCSIQLTDIKQ